MQRVSKSARQQFDKSAVRKKQVLRLRTLRVLRSRTVEAIGQDGQMRLKMDGGRDVQLDPREHPHLDHGYAVTSHSSQGQTAERVLIHVDTGLAAKDLLNSRMAYVAVSRGAEDAQVYTNDRAKLPEALGHDVSHESAHTPVMKPEQVIKPLQPEIAPVIEHGLGHSL
jgi:ATP-dependent exoDNAse (exonuclease V) alpha subunit